MVALSNAFVPSWSEAAALDRVALVGRLKDWEFSLKEIREIVDSCVDDTDRGPRLLSQARPIAAEAVHGTRIRQEIEQFQKTLEVEPMGVSVESLSEQVLPDLLVVSLRFLGPYEDVGASFAQLFRTFGRWAAGAPMALYHDPEFQEEADIEACLPLRRAISFDGFETKTLVGGRALCLTHGGPHSTLGSSSRRLTDGLKDRGWQVRLATREVYLKGPGRVFPRNPSHFVTQIQFFAEPASPSP